MTETESLLQLWADILADVQADKAFMQQVERAAVPGWKASGRDCSWRLCGSSARCGRRPEDCSRALPWHTKIDVRGVTPCLHTPCWARPGPRRTTSASCAGQAGSRPSPRAKSTSNTKKTACGRSAARRGRWPGQSTSGACTICPPGGGST